MSAQRSKESQPTVTPTSVHLPLEVVAEILSRLPVKHLIQLCCVCKSWNSLISGNSNFAKKHFHLSTSSYYRHHLVLTPTIPSYSSPGEFRIFHSPISSIFSSTFPTFVKTVVYSIREIFFKGAGDGRVSTCDGMLCFNIDNSSVMLCNPFIQKFKILPPFQYPARSSLQYPPGQSSDPIFFTLVHDRFINNYKIIAVHTPNLLNIDSKIEIHIHTLGTDYWRRIDDFPYSNHTLVSRSGKFVKDSVNWLVYVDAMFIIVSLDFEKDSYQKLSLPVFYDDVTNPFTLGTLRGCLSLLCDNKRDKICDVWIMKEYGNEKSWTKLLTVPHRKERFNFKKECDFYGYTKALHISEDGKALMQCMKMGTRLIIYDSINNTFEKPSLCTPDDGMTPEVYVESLISPF